MAKTKLLLIGAGSGETAQLAQDIHRKLKDDYDLDDKVELLLAKKRTEVDPDFEKGYRSPLVLDYFSDFEAQADVGRNDLKDIIRGKHVAIVTHLLTPNMRISEDGPQIVSPNDHIMQVRGLLNLIKNVETLQRTLAAPYMSYVRSHSVEKYMKFGFFQFDSLRMVLEDLSRDTLNAIVTIDPHSNKADQIAEELGMEFHGLNPFQSARAINPYKLGVTGEKAERVRKGLRPFQERFEKLKKEHEGHLYLICVDDGTERRTENFADRAFSALKITDVYAMIAYLFKGARMGYGDAATRFKPFSQINESNIDPEGVYVAIDDMFASSGTMQKAARIFKEGGAKRVEVWTSHAVTMPLQHEKANGRKYIDHVVCLDTVPQHPNLDVEYIQGASANLLSAGLYKAHQKLMAER